MINHLDHVAPRSNLSRSTRRLLSGVLFAVSFLLFANSASAQFVSYECGDLRNGFGPFDYTDPNHRVIQTDEGETESKLGVVERVHFTPEIEALIRGFYLEDPLSDLEYTLRAFPNHHRALSAIAKYHVSKGAGKHGLYSIDCWFERAMTFRPDDALVRVTYAIYLLKRGRDEMALTQYQKAIEIQPDSADAQYGIGLLYTKMENYDLASAHAKRAYELGYPLPGLRNRLVKAGVWKQELDEE